MPSYAAAGGGSASYGQEDSFSVTKVFGFAFDLFFSFNGRIGRAQYWTIGIFRFVLMIGVIFSFVSQLPVGATELTEEEIGMALFTSQSGLIHLALFAVLMICYWSLEVRRSHDRGKSGLFLLILFVPIIGSIYGIYIFIVNGFVPGTRGPNQFDTVQSQAHVFD
ncbi:MAG: DUF805 domain-containing protein [Roseibium sp.]|uniref:DUF805 domain-containing protein n=1 Tax=Roseibium sp. TaxID=1936156 RepID=UPI002632BC46|nr:DUF805 domain-containing protein [Roseibium sp.]MCV0429605.1 DUF805 domain-containing protein [Roseibium sp.]